VKPTDNPEGDGRTPLVAAGGEARRHLEGLLLIQQVAEAVHTSASLGDYLDVLIERIMAAVGVRHCSLMLRGGDGRLFIAAARGLSADVIAETRIAPGEGIAGQVLASGEPLLIPDLDADPRFDRNRGFDHYLCNSLLSVPLKCRGEVRGVLNVNDKEDGSPFGDRDLHLLSGVAHLATLALENLRLVTDLQGSRQQLENSNRQLQELLQGRSRLVCNLSHELKTPLASVLGYVDLTLNHFEQLDPEEVRVYLERVQEEGLQMKRLINGMLTLFSLESGAGRWQWQRLSPAELLSAELERRKEDIANRELRIDARLAETLPEIEGDRDRFRQMLAALLDNAIKFNRPGGRLQIDLQGLGNELELRIFNEGVCVPAEAAETIFEQYIQLGAVESGKPAGVGIGLAICRAIVDRLGGKIRLEPGIEEGTCVVALLPINRPEGNYER